MPFSRSSLVARLGSALAAVGLIAALAACGGSRSPAPSPGTSRNPAAPTGGQGTSAAQAQAPVPTESNPPGDIPDSTVYVTYRSAAGHLSVKVPEGWSRQEGSSSATFTSKLNSVSVQWMPMASEPTVSSVRAKTVPALQSSTPAFRLQSVRAVPLPGGPAVETIYQVNSPPDQVTGRQYRLVVERFELYRGGRGAVLILSSAVGSDNADPWRTVSESFQWM